VGPLLVLVPDAPEAPPPVPVPAPPVAGPAGVVVAGAAGVTDAELLAAAEPPVDADGVDPLDPVDPVVAVVGVVVVRVVVVDEDELGAEDAVVEVGTVNGGTSEVSAVVDPLPHAAMPTESATPVIRAATKVHVRARLGTLIWLRRGAISRADPFACRSAGSRSGPSG
jgi:hypothetical protein